MTRDRADYYRGNRTAVLARAKAHDQRLAAETGAKAVLGGKPWTNAEDAVALRDDLTVRELAFMLGRTHGAVSRRREELRGSKRAPLSARTRCPDCGQRLDIAPHPIGGLHLARCSYRWDVA